MKYFLIAIFSLVTTPATLSQIQTGEVEGRVTDAETGQPLVGANVTIRGTFLGAITDTSGIFRIRRIGIGKRSVVVSMIGYATKSVPDVIVDPGKTSSLSVHLSPQAVASQQVVVTASRREQNSNEVPVSIATVSASALANRITTTLDDALRYVPGVNLMYDQINIRGSSGYSRGVGTRVLLLFDGLPYLTGDTGEITWETIPVFQIDRIEVVKGAGSALYGSSALGGVINVITKDIPDGPNVGFRLFSGIYSKPGYDEWDWSPQPRFSSGGYVSYSDKSGPLGYLFSVSRSVDESFRENDAYHRWDLYLRSSYDLSPVQKLTLVGNVMLRSHGNFFWWKSLREATRPADIQRDGDVQSNRGNISLSYKEFASDKFFYTIKSIYYGNFWRDDSAGRINNVSASHYFYTEAQGTYVFSPANTFTAGVAANYDEVTSNLFGTHPGVGVALFAQDDLSLTGELKLTAGARFDWQRVSILPAGSQLNPKLGLVYALSESNSLRASLGTGFRYPAISELFTSVNTGVSQLNIVPNPDLKPESSISYEVGITQSFPGSVLLDAAVFQNNYTDLIEAGVETNHNPLEIKFANITKARILGAELDVKVDLIDRVLAAEGGYTYIDSRDLTTGEVLKFRPRHTLYGTLQLSVEHLTLVGDYRYLSRVESIDTNLVRFAPIADGDQLVPIKVADLRAFYEFSGEGLPIRLGLSVTNMFNYHYVELIGNLAPVRLVTFSIDGHF